MKCTCTILSSVACPALQYYSTLSHKRYDFRNRTTEYKMCALIFATTFVWNISHSKTRTERDMIKMYTGLHVKYPLFLFDFNGTRIFSTDFRKIFKYQISWKSAQWELSCSMLTDKWTDTTKLIVAFFHFTYTLINDNRRPHATETVYLTQLLWGRRNIHRYNHYKNNCSLRGEPSICR